MFIKFKQQNTPHCSAIGIIGARFLIATLIGSSIFATLHAAEGLPKGYELDEQTVSPDGRFGVLFPAQESSDEFPNLLVRLEPYKILATVAKPSVPTNATTSLLAEWQGNSVVAVWQFRRWGIVDLKVYELAADGSVKAHAVWEAVREVFRKDFQERFQKAYPEEPETMIFVSEEGEENPRRDFELKGRKVRLDVAADNKPNLAGGPHWSATMKAEWNLDTGRLEKVKFRPGEISVREQP